jgi:hypothetical protein
MFAYSLADLTHFMEVQLQTNKTPLAEALFVAKVNYRELGSQEYTPSIHPAILYNDLIKLASGFQLNNSQALMAKINQNLLVRRQYADLVKRLCFANSQLHAAAASDKQGMPTRQTDSFSLTFKRDSMAPSQVFALLHINHPTDGQNTAGVIVHALTQKHCERIEFPSLIDGTTQYLFDESDPKLQFLLDGDAEISIMP